MNHIPQKVYEHIKYSTGGDACGPLAVMIVNNKIYSLTQEFGFVAASVDGKRIGLAYVPESTGTDWTLYG